MTIATMTGRLFSHSAIWLPRVPGSAALTGIWRLELFESEDSGVGATSLAKAYFTTRRDGARELGLLISDAVSIALFRHPMIESLEPKFLEEAADRLREKEQYLGYSEFDRLALAANRIPLLKPYIASFLRSHDHDRDVTLIPGSFCSELVAKYFDELGLALFEPRRAPETIAPNDLADSLLREVKGAILNTSDLHEVEHLRSLELSRKEFLPHMVRFRSQSIRTSQQVEILEETFSRGRGDTLGMQSSLLSAGARQAAKKAEDAERYGDLVMAHRLSITAKSHMLALALCHEIMKRREQPALASNKVWPNAEARLAHALSRLSSQLDRQLARQSGLVDIGFARRWYKAGRSEELGMKLLEIRRTVIAQWRTKIEMDEHVRKIFVKVEETFYEDEDVTAMIEDVMTSTINLAHEAAVKGASSH